MKSAQNFEMSEAARLLVRRQLPGDSNPHPTSRHEKQLQSEFA